jgi:hypothetical protein
MNMNKLREYLDVASYKTAYTLRANALVLGDIKLFGCKIVSSANHYVK